MSENLDSLRERALAGDDMALSGLLGALQPMVLRRCSDLLRSRDDAEEAAQDALLAISAKLASYSGQGPFLGWVNVVASNAARSTHRKVRRHLSEVTAGDAVLLGRPEPRTTSVIAGTKLDLLEALDALEASHPSLVEPVMLREFGGLSYEEIAQQLGQPLGTVKASIHRARQFLREQLVLRID